MSLDLYFIFFSSSERRSPISLKYLDFLLLLVIPPWEGIFLLPSRSFPHLPTLLPLPKHPNTHTHTQINLRFLSQNTEPALHRSYPHLFPAFSRFSFNQQILLALPLFIHHIYGFLRFGVWNRFLGFRSTHLHPLSQDMLLSNGFAGVSGFRRWSSPSPLLPIAERSSLGGAWFSRTSWDGSHTASSATFVAAVFVFVCLFYWAYLLYHSPLILVFGSLWLNTLVKSPSLVTPTSWHPCLELMSPHLRKYCPRVLTFLDYILGCPSPSVFVFLIFSL